MTSKDYEVIGGYHNFWLYSKKHGYDLTHPPAPDAAPIYPRLSLETTTGPVTVDPKKSALVVIDLQNYFLSPALGRPSRGTGVDTVNRLLKYVIPACRKAGMPIVWLGWGLTEQDIEEMPPIILRGFRHDTNFTRRVRWPVGKLGMDIGLLRLEDGSNVEGGKVLKKGEWNTKTYAPLADQAKPHDITIHKSRLNGFWVGTRIEEALNRCGIRTLIFAGCNTDQCVAGSLQGASTQGWDCLMLGDCCGTSSPAFAGKCVEHNTEGGWGFVLTCSQLVNGIDNMQMRSDAEP